MDFRLRTSTTVVFRFREVRRSLSPVLGPGGHPYSIFIKLVIIHTHNPHHVVRLNDLFDAGGLLFRETRFYREQEPL